MEPEEAFQKVFSLLRQHHEWFRNSIPLIASENVVSPAVKEAVVTDFMHRYAEGWPGERVYAGCKYIDQVELLAIDLAKKLFRADFADVRPISGVVANLVVYTTLTQPGDTMFALPIPSGGHISMGPLKAKTGDYLGGTAGAVRGLAVEYFKLDEKEMNIDVTESAKRIREVKPKLLMFGASVFLFPHPVRELAEVAREVGARVAFDAAHVSGLIAGGHFQDPLREGAEMMSMSTHKTLPGPQHGTVVARGELGETIKKVTFPGLVSNHHLHNVAGLAVALVEMLKFGGAYTGKVIENAKRLGQSLYERGFEVLCPDKGFTESHTVIIDISKFGDGASIEEKLEAANIITNRNLLPWDKRLGRDYRKPGGLRLGTSEVTRLGMGGSEMDEIAELIKRIVVDKDSPRSVAEEVAELRAGFQKVHYCFDSTRNAYDYIGIR
jgi:glycine hydroxymethyltransferase